MGDKVGSFVKGKQFDAIMLDAYGKQKKRNKQFLLFFLFFILSLLSCTNANTNLVSCTVADGPIDMFDQQSVDEMVQKLIFCADDRSIQRVFVGGRLIGGREFQQQQQQPI